MFFFCLLAWGRIGKQGHIKYSPHISVGVGERNILPTEDVLFFFLVVVVVKMNGVPWKGHLLEVKKIGICAVGNSSVEIRVAGLIKKLTFIVAKYCIFDIYYLEKL